MGFRSKFGGPGYFKDKKSIKYIVSIFMRLELKQQTEHNLNVKCVSLVGDIYFEVVEN